MSLPLDLSLLQSDQKFQSLCFYLARKKFPKAIPVAHGSWDGGRDIISFGDQPGDIIWQCKFSQQSLSNLKPKIVESLQSLESSRPVSTWILCLSVDASGVFHDWLRETVARYPFIRSWEVWDKQLLLKDLNQYPDVLEMFFYPVWKSLEERFRTEELELVRYDLDPDCGWIATGPPTLHFAQVKGSSSDLLLDVIVRSRGNLQSLLHSMRLEVFDVRYPLRGLPGEGLLYPQYTYSISLEGGKPGCRTERLEPPVTIDGGKHQRFKIKLTDSGYAWTGFIRMTLLYAVDRELALPCTFLKT